jgi:uncharacterized SAM-dependent methyltransferase
MSQLLGPQGGLLIGIDLQKDISTIVAAYDDSEGVTARFNLNLLSRINRELEGNFDVTKFSHKATYNEVEHRIEISIVSSEEQSVAIGDDVFQFAANEEVLTEYSHKYSIEGFAKLAQRHGFSLHKQWTDRKELFGVLHLVLDQEASLSKLLRLLLPHREELSLLSHELLLKRKLALRCVDNDLIT